MKNIKQLAALAALLTVANPAKSEEKDFTPMGKAEAIESIQLVNGQILVTPQDKKVPLYFVNTNTNHFVDKAFANADMTNLNSVAVSKDAVWATRNGQLLKYPFGTKKALNNVPTQVETSNLTDVQRVVSVNGNNVIAFTKDGALATYHIDGDTATMTSMASTSYQNGDDTYTAQQENGGINIFKGETVSWKFSNHSAEPTSLVAFGDKKFYLLTDDGNLYSSIRQKTNKLTDKPIMTGITSLAATQDGNGLLISDNTGKVMAYSVNEENSQLNTDVKGNFVGTPVFDPTKVATNNFTANGMMYYARDKKLGWERQ